MFNTVFIFDICAPDFFFTNSYRREVLTHSVRDDRKVWYAVNSWNYMKTCYCLRFTFPCVQQFAEKYVLLRIYFPATKVFSYWLPAWIDCRTPFWTHSFQSLRFRISAIVSSLWSIPLSCYISLTHFFSFDTSEERLFDRVSFSFLFIRSPLPHAFVVICSGIGNIIQ